MHVHDFLSSSACAAHRRHSSHAAARQASIAAVAIPAAWVMTNTPLVEKDCEDLKSPGSPSASVHDPSLLCWHLGNTTQTQEVQHCLC